jgi:hypothetical protein
MKLSIISLLFLLVIIVPDSFGQRTVNVPAGFATINNVIGGDTTSTGERVDINTVYLLERGGEYILDGEFSPAYQCIIEAAPGDGPRPRIILGVPTGGVTPEQTIRPRADFYIKGVYVSALDELGAVSLRIFRFEEVGIKIVVDDCHLDFGTQAAFRINTRDNTLIIRNSIVSNIGTMASPENGRAFDDRGNDVDTMIVENCTFYNLTFKVLRDGGGRINYAYFNQNTMVNIGMGGVDIGEALDVTFTNNIFRNPVHMGNRNVPMEALRLRNWTGEGTQNVDISHNNIFIDPALVAIFPDTIKGPVPFDSLSNFYITQAGTGSTNIEEQVSFTDGPESPVTIVQTYWQNPPAASGFLDTLGHMDFDFSYATTYQSYTGGTTGQPLGDLNWFDSSVDVKDYTYSPAEFKLFSNYPNPFNPSTKISYYIPSSSFVTLKVYNSLGQEIAVLINGELQAGLHQTDFTSSGLSSGIYFYKLEAGSFTQTNKMILMK